MAKIIGTPYLPKAFPVVDEQAAKNLLPRRYPPVGLSDTIEVIRNTKGEPIGQNLLTVRAVFLTMKKFFGFIA